MGTLDISGWLTFKHDGTDKLIFKYPPDWVVIPDKYAGSLMGYYIGSLKGKSEKFPSFEGASFIEFGGRQMGCESREYLRCVYRGDFSPMWTASKDLEIIKIFDTASSTVEN